MIGLPGHKHYSVGDAMKLTPAKPELIGKWVVVNDGVRADPICERIGWLPISYLEKIASSKRWDDWETVSAKKAHARYQFTGPAPNNNS